jgi:acetylornithine/N-succinyldiaminopimelate aminotransferase
MKSGKGCKLFAADGREFLDCVSGIATCALGHSNDALSKAVTDQMKQVHHVSNLYLIPAQAGLAKWLCDNSVAQKVFFCNSGAEANEAAIKIARRHASNRGITKPVIITAEQSFHGRTLAALSATAQPKYHKGFGYDGSMVPGFEYVPYNDAAALEKKVKEIQDSGRGLAAIMMEALQGEGGIIPGDKKFFAKVRSICDETGALMMCDEVQVGMGRSGRLWGYQNLDVEPDVFTSAKALGGGVPIGAMMAGPKVADVFGPGDHASTYGGNPLAWYVPMKTSGFGNQRICLSVRTF